MYVHNVYSTANLIQFTFGKFNHMMVFIPSTYLTLLQLEELPLL